MQLHERTLNIGLGVSCFGWAIAGISVDGVSVVRCSLAALQVVVGILFLFRIPHVQFGDWRQLALALPSLIASGVAFKLRPDDWADGWSVVFAVGSAGAIASLLSLGRSFAVLPSLRVVVTGGPYRLIRHPIYFAELIMVSACCFAVPSLLRVGVLAVAIICLVYRINVEEALLGNHRDYQAYLAGTRWRMLPGIW